MRSALSQCVLLCLNACCFASMRWWLQGSRLGAQQELHCVLPLFFKRCLSTLTKRQRQHHQHQHQHHQQQQQQQQQRQGQTHLDNLNTQPQAPPSPVGPNPATRFVLLLLVEIGSVSLRASSANVLLQALAHACEATHSPTLTSRFSIEVQQSSQQPGVPQSQQQQQQQQQQVEVPHTPPLCMSPHHLTSHVRPLLQRILFLRPAWQCAAVRGAVLRVVAASLELSGTSAGERIVYRGRVRCRGFHSSACTPCALCSSVLLWGGSVACQVYLCV